MTAVTRLVPSQVSDYAPGAASTHLSEVTVAAVDKIGNNVTDQIEDLIASIEDRAAKIVETILNEAKEKAENILAETKATIDEMRAVKLSYRDFTRGVSQDVSDFCLTTSTALSTVRGLQSNIKGKIKGDLGFVRPIASDHDDGEPSSAFLHKHNG